MKCPVCSHVSDKALQKCSSCDSVFDFQGFEELQHVTYLQSWLDDQANVLSPAILARLRRETNRKLALIRKELRLDELAASASPVSEASDATTVADLREDLRPTQEIAGEYNLVRSVINSWENWEVDPSRSWPQFALFTSYMMHRATELRRELETRTWAEGSGDVREPTELMAISFAIRMIPKWVAYSGVSSASATTLRIKLEKRRNAIQKLGRVPPQAARRPVVAKPASPTKVEEPPKPREPLFDWAKIRQGVIDAAASGALLRGLLYLGAFMIVVSIAVLVINFWELIPLAVQLGFIAAVPAAFYLAGWLIRDKLKLPQAGSVLTGIGMLLVAVDFTAVFKFGELADSVDQFLFWFGASLFCTALYAVTAWRVPPEAFGYVTLLALTSTFVSFGYLVRFDVGFIVAMVPLSSVIILGVSHYLSKVPDQWAPLALSARRLPAIMIPFSQIFVIFAPGGIGWSQALTYGLASIGYALLALLFPISRLFRRIFSHAATLSSAGALGFAFVGIQLRLVWAATAAALFAPIYLLSGRLLELKGVWEETKRKIILEALYVTGFGLLTVAILGGLLTLVFDIWAGVIALAIVSLILTGCAYLFRQHLFLLGAFGLFVLPYSIAISEWLQKRESSQILAWLLVGWAVLALAYITLAFIMRKADRYAFWLYLLAHALAPLTILGVVSDYVFGPDPWYAIPAVLSLGGVLLVYLSSALILDSGRHPALKHMASWLPAPFNRSVFLWPVAVVAPLWITAAWTGSGFKMAWLGVIFSGLALAYVAIGQALIRRDPCYRLPFHTSAYMLPLVGIAIASDDSWALLTTLLVSVSVLISLSTVYRRVWEVAGAALLFIWPFQLALELSPLRTHSYSLAYSLLAIVVYIPIAMALASRRLRDSWKFVPEYRPSWKDTPQAMAVFTTGYWLAVYAVATSILGRFAFYTLDISWIGVLVPLIVSGLAIFSVYRLRQKPFAWAAIILISVAYWQTLTLFGIPSEYHAVAWIALAIALVLLERLVIHQLDRDWWSDFSWPLGGGAAALCAIGLVLTAYPTYQAFNTDEAVNYLPIIIAQSLAVLMSVLAAWMYKSRLPLFLEPYLAFFPVTLIFLAYGERLVGGSLETAQFSFVWLGLSVIQLVVALLVDTDRIRYSHGLYLGGYSISLLALGWSILDWQTHIYTLGGIILISVASQFLVHTNRHLSWDDFVRRLWREPGSIGWRGARSTFLFIAVYAFPIWLVQLLAFNEVSLAWRGAACALVAPLYVALGLWLRTFRSEYTWSLYSAGYALTAIGAMVAYNDQRLFIAVLSLNAVVYAVSSFIFGQAFWLYITNTLVPVIVLLILDYNNALTSQWIAGVFMGLAFIYIAIGWLFDRRMAGKDISPFSLPFYIFGYLVSSVALAVGSDERMLAIGVFSSAVVLYGASAWLFRETIFLYPAAWLAAVPYFLVMTLTDLPSEWWGVGLLPLIVVYILAGRYIFHKTPFNVKDWPGFLHSFGRPEMPFYLLAYAGSVAMVILSNFLIAYSDQEGIIINQRDDLLPLTMSLTAASLIYYGSAILFRTSTWLYPGLLTSHLAILSYLAITPSGSPIYYTSLPFVAVTWILALLGLAFERRSSDVQYKKMPRFDVKIWRIEIILGGWSFAGRLITRTWSQPFYVFAAIDAVLWQLVALGGSETTIVVAVAFALLTGLLSILWQDGSLTYVSLIYLIIAIGARLDSVGLTLAQGMACMTAIGFALYFIAELTEQRERLASRLSIWRRPIQRMAVVMSLIAVLGTLPTAASQTLATAIALGFSGALYLAIAYRGRRYSLGYMAMAMLQIAWVLLLLDRNVSQPQFYAIPAGLYFVIIGELERRRGRNAFANYLCAFGLAVIFLTSFIQSLDTNTGLPYFILLLIESLMTVGYGVFKQEKVPFFAGLSAAFLNVIGQLILLTTVSDVLRWIVILGTGLLLVSLAILVERRRKEIASQIGEWRTALSTWS